WGSNLHGQTSVPEDHYTGGKEATAIAAGQYQSMALLDDGTVRAWGRSSNGGPASVPDDLNAGGKKATAIAAGQYQIMAIVEGLPSPTRVSAQGDVASATVSFTPWSATLDDTTYTVTATSSDGGQAVTKDTTSSPVTLTGLTGG